MTDKLKILQDDDSAINNQREIREDYINNDGKWHNRFCFPTRYIFTLWGFFGFTIIYTLRVNLSVAIIAMVNRSAIVHNYANYSPECHYLKLNWTKPREGEFVWNENIQGFILGAFFWGYIPLQVPAGWIAAKIGGKWLFGIGVLWTSVLTIITPPFAKLGYGWLIAIRILEGLGESVTFPAMHAMLGQWAPRMEISFMSGIVYSGFYFGLVTGLIGSTILIDKNIMGGWPSVFYIPGIIGIVWFIIWSLVVYSTPAAHPRISSKELKLIESSVNLSKNETSYAVPWKDIMLSWPVWAIIVANFCSGWSLCTIMTNLPQYFRYILGLSIREIGFVTAVPQLLGGVMIVVTGKLADTIMSKHWLGTTATRKLFNSIGMIVGAVSVVVIGYTGCDKDLLIITLCISAAISNLCNAGFNVNHIDLAPQYAGILCGITNTIADVAGIIEPSVAGALTNNMQTKERWQIVFFISFGVTVFGAIFFVVFGSGERQPWANERSKLDISGFENQTDEIL